MTVMANLTGLLKESYAPKIETLYVASAILGEDIKFVPNKSMNGGNYNQPVVMSPEQGFTYAAPSSAGPSLTPYVMNPAVSMQMQNALVVPSQMSARCVIDFETANRSVANRAFEPIVTLQMTNVMTQAKTRLELSLLYGQEALATTASTSAASATVTNVVFTVGSWADAIWGSTLNAQLNFFTAAGVIIGATAADQVYQVTKVTAATRTIQVTSTSAGATALVAAAAGAGAFFQGARLTATTFNEMAGISKIISNTGSLFNIDAAANDLWSGNVVSAGGVALTMQALNKAVGTAVGRGLTGNVNVYVNPLTWGNLLDQANAQRVYDSSYSTTKTKNGATQIEFYSQNGTMFIKPHPFVKPADAFILPVDQFSRVGSTDITFKADALDSKDATMFTRLENVGGYQYTLYTGQAVFCSTPSQATKITNIVNV